MNKLQDDVFFFLFNTYNWKLNTQNHGNDQKKKKN